MKIDWFTTIAQIVNFVVLVLLLRRFLYRPIIAAMERRQQALQAQRQEADEARAEAAERKAEYDALCDGFAEEKASQLRALSDEVEAVRNAQMEEARRQVEAAKEQWEQQLQEQQEGFAQRLQVQLQEQVFALARRAFADLADASLEASVVDAFVARLAEERESLRESLRAPDEGMPLAVTISSAFVLDEEQRVTLRAALEETLGHSVAVSWSVEPEVLGGIHCLIPGGELRWSLNAYLDQLQHVFSGEGALFAGAER